MRLRTLRNKAVYVALGITPDGAKDVLGLWIEQTEGAKFWLQVMNEPQARGVQDILLAVVDGLKGFPEVCRLAGRRRVAAALNAIFGENLQQRAHSPTVVGVPPAVIESSPAQPLPSREH